ncbi:MAG: hypothetical protein UV25_C0047G0008, partial [candidate division WWE3 bacterium GW2011_GWB1_42_41]
MSIYIILAIILLVHVTFWSS